MKKQQEGRFGPSTTVGIPQPWESEQVDEAKYIAEAVKKEGAGSRLVVETWVNAYPDLLDGDLWVVDWLDYSDWRTGEHIWGFNPEETDAEATNERDGFIVVERRLAESY